MIQVSYNIVEFTCRKFIPIAVLKEDSDVDRILLASI